MSRAFSSFHDFFCYFASAIINKPVMLPLSPFGEGEGMGLFCAGLAAACVTGSALGGWLAAQWGYNAAAGMAVITDALGLILMYKIELAR